MQKMCRKKCVIERALPVCFPARRGYYYGSRTDRGDTVVEDDSNGWWFPHGTSAGFGSRMDTVVENVDPNGRWVPHGTSERGTVVDGLQHAHAGHPCEYEVDHVQNDVDEAQNLQKQDVFLINSLSNGSSAIA